MRSLIVGASIAVVVAGCTGQSQTLDAAAASNSLAKAETPNLSDPPSQGQSPAESFDVGDAAPTFADLQGVDDERHGLEDYAEAKAIVIAFICNHCPVAVAYEDRLINLQNDYEEKGVQVVAINVNNMEEDKLPAMKERAEAKGFTFSYLYDPSQKVGRDYGATVTPHVFLLDNERQLAYLGPIDDSQDEAKVTEQFLRDAIDAVLAGNSPTTTSVKPFGCGIRYE